MAAARAESQALEQAIAKIESHLAKTPDDVKGWEVLAPVYMRLGRFEAAVAADGALVSRRAALFRDGASNVREILELRWRSGEGADAAGSVDAGRAR